MLLLLAAVFQALVYPSVAIGVVACTISKSKMFKWLRGWTKEESFVGELLRCPYCLAHWLAFGAAWVAPINWSEWVVLDWFVQSMVLVGLSTLTTRMLLETYFGFDPED
jgi:hypothetical protein